MVSGPSVPVTERTPPRRVVYRPEAKSVRSSRPSSSSRRLGPCVWLMGRFLAGTCPRDHFREPGVVTPRFAVDVDVIRHHVGGVARAAAVLAAEHADVARAAHDVTGGCPLIFGTRPAGLQRIAQFTPALNDFSEPTVTNGRGDCEGGHGGRRNPLFRRNPGMCRRAGDVPLPPLRPGRPDRHAGGRTAAEV